MFFLKVRLPNGRRWCRRWDIAAHTTGMTWDSRSGCLPLHLSAPDSVPIPWGVLILSDLAALDQNQTHNPLVIGLMLYPLSNRPRPNVFYLRDVLGSRFVDIISLRCYSFVDFRRSSNSDWPPSIQTDHLADLKIRKDPLVKLLKLFL